MTKSYKIFLILMLLFFESTSFAITIVSIKKDKVLLKMDQGQPIQIGYQFNILEAKKIVAKIKIINIKEDSAIAAVEGVLENSKAASYSLIPVSSNDSFSFMSLKNNTWGLLVGFNQSMTSVTLTEKSSVELNGNGFSVEGLFQYPLTSSYEAMSRFGYSTLKGTGKQNISGTCGGGPCQIDDFVDFGYLNLDVVLKYLLPQSGYRFWVGGGLGFLYAINKSSNAVDTGNMTTNQKLIFSSGLDWKLNDKKTIPIQLDYSYFPDISNIKTSQIILRTGLIINY